jgi:hypothetical protein
MRGRGNGFLALYRIGSGQTNATQWAIESGRDDNTVMRWVHTSTIPKVQKLPGRSWHCVQGSEAEQLELEEMPEGAQESRPGQTTYFFFLRMRLLKPEKALKVSPVIWA